MSKSNAAIETTKKSEQQQANNTKLRRNDSKLVKTPKPSCDTQLESSAKLDDQERLTVTNSKTLKQSSDVAAKVREFVPDTTERLPHTRQLSSAALQLSPRHHPSLLAKLGTASHATNDTANNTTASSSSTSSSSSTTTVTSSTTLVGAAPLVLSKCPSLASVNSYYLPNDETVANTSDEYYEDTEEDGQSEQTDDDNVFVANTSHRSTTTHVNQVVI